VREARATFNEAHVAAETATARFADLKTKVGSNEADRKTAKANTPEDVYAGYLTDYAAAELDKIAAVAASDRAQKNYDGLREELQHETAEINRAWAEIADRTARPTRHSRCSRLHACYSRLATILTIQNFSRGHYDQHDCTFRRIDAGALHDRSVRTAERGG
jgi:hypothetical protein